jgi:Ser/Thr protein kinase RdoA (MazF antagonist)
MAGPGFVDVRSAADYLTSEVLRAEETAARLSAVGLPEHLLHADLHSLNVLMEGEDTVTGLLDFEFSCIEWRACEAAVGLSKYVAVPGIEPVVEAWIEG